MDCLGLLFRAFYRDRQVAAYVDELGYEVDLDTECVPTACRSDYSLPVDVHAECLLGDVGVPVNWIELGVRLAYEHHLQLLLRPVDIHACILIALNTHLGKKPEGLRIGESPCLESFIAQGRVNDELAEITRIRYSHTTPIVTSVHALMMSMLSTQPTEPRVVPVPASGGSLPALHIAGRLSDWGILKEVCRQLGIFLKDTELGEWMCNDMTLLVQRLYTAFDSTDTADLGWLSDSAWVRALVPYSHNGCSRVAESDTKAVPYG